MKKLIIKFWQNENVVMMKVLEQDERLRNKGKIFKDKNLDMAICSTRFPKIFPTSIFIRGVKKEKIILSVALALTQLRTPLSI